MKQLLVLLGLIFALELFAQEGARLGEPDFRGNGCGRNTASASISDDRQTLSVLFDSYIAEVGGALRQRADRKACNILIPIEVPRGYSVAVFKVDYRGFNSLPAGAKAEFKMDYFFGGRVGPRNIQSFEGPLENDFITNNNISTQIMEWSPCGRQMVLRAHSVMTLRTNREGEQALSTIDSADFQAGVTFKLQWRRCEERRQR